MTIKRLFSGADDHIESIRAQIARNPYPASEADWLILSGDQIADLLEAAYWSSLLLNEGRTTQVRVAAAVKRSLKGMPQFSTPVPYNEVQIAKLGPAVPPRGCLLVDPIKMEIWAICRQRPAFAATITLDVVRPGVVHVGVGAYRTFAVFSGRTATMVLASGKIDLSDSIRTALGEMIPPNDPLETQAVWREAFALADIAANVRANGHGGALLLVPDDDDGWSSSVDPLGFRFDVRDSTIPDSIRSEIKRYGLFGQILQGISQTDMQDADKAVVVSNALPNDWVDRSALESIARLAAVDGAVVLTSAARVIGFGAKINVKGSRPPVSRIGAGSKDQEVDSCELEDLGGMRHQSAARFVGANRNCAAVVVSEDGPMSFMSWHAELKCVLVVRNVDWWC